MAFTASKRESIRCLVRRTDEYNKQRIALFYYLLHPALTSGNMSQDVSGSGGSSWHLHNEKIRPQTNPLIISEELKADGMVYSR
jgi:hypothetical protein